MWDEYLHYCVSRNLKKSQLDNLKTFMATLK